MRPGGWWRSRGSIRRSAAAQPCPALGGDEERRDEEGEPGDRRSLPARPRAPRRGADAGGGGPGRAVRRRHRRWGWSLGGDPRGPTRPPDPRHRPGPRCRRGGGRGAPALRGPGPHRARRLRAGRRHRGTARGGSGAAWCTGRPTRRGKRGRRGNPVRPGREQPAARPSGTGLLVLGRRGAARHAHGQRCRS